MKVIKDIIKYVVLLWLGTAVLVLGLDVFLDMDIDLIICILTLIFTTILAITNKHNILQVVVDLVISFIISIVLVWGIALGWSLLLDIGTSILSGPLYLVVVFTIATIASISKHNKSKVQVKYM